MIEKFYSKRLKVFFRIDNLGIKLADELSKLQTIFEKFHGESQIFKKSFAEEKQENPVIFLDEQEDEFETARRNFLTLIEATTDKRTVLQDKELYLKSIYDKSSFQKIVPISSIKASEIAKGAQISEVQNRQPKELKGNHLKLFEKILKEFYD